jgi:hypothetical protein
MMRLIATLFFVCLTIQPVFADDDMAGIDRARVFPVQKNKTIIHSSSKDDKDASENQLGPSAFSDEKKPPKDTALLINGNGGSTNRSAGGNATLRKRFTFD